MPARTGWCRLFWILLLACGKLPAQAPVLFFSDIPSGSNTGGENGNGAYVSLYGNYFGASQGSSTVTAPGGAMVNCTVWGAAWLWYQKITCQLGPNAATGSLIVTVNGQSSNPLPFTVAPGNIYFIATTGNDNNPGTFAAPWRTLLRARDAMLPGDIAYAMDGVTQSTDDGTGWDAAFLLSGGDQGKWCSATGLPRALAAYPGATVTIGNATGGLPDFGVRTSDCQGNWVFSGISFRGQNPAQAGSGSHYRFAGSDITCPYTQGIGGGACFQTSQASYVDFYGNHVYNAGTANASALFQAVYFSTDSNDIDMGWNLVEYVHGCRGLQVHSSPLGSGGPQDPTGYDQFDISIHDNTLHDTQCDGMIVDTVDPSRGPVSIYNNVVYNAGIGPNNPEGTGGWNCINVPGSTANGPAGSGTVEVFNNSLFACGTFTSPPYGSNNNAVAENGDEAPGAPPIYVHIRNNMLYSVPTTLYPGGVPYVVVWDPLTDEPCANSQNCPWLYGTNNLMYGAGNPVTNMAEITGTVSANPLVVSTSLPDLHLTSGSPAIQAGTVIGAIGVFGAGNTGRDHDGLPRGPVPSIGAYEASSATSYPNYVISGQVLTAEGGVLSGVTVAWSGTGSGSTSTNGSGDYELVLPAFGSYVVTPSLAGYIFMPPSQTFDNLSGNQTANFTANAAGNTYTISGQATLYGNALGGVMVTLSGSQSGAVTTNGSGNYAFTVPAGGDYAVTPSLTGHYFYPYPPGFTFRNLSGNQTADFQAAVPSDFNHDGHPDVIWEEPTIGWGQIWYLGGLQGVSITDTADLSQANPWQIVGVADFNGDGYPDVVWQNPVSGAVQVWYLGGPLGNQLVEALDITIGNPWRVVSVADFNGDGHPDLLWQDPTNGFAQIWYLGGPDGSTLLGAADLDQTNPWNIVGTGDLNGDGVPDVLWQDPVSGTVQIWYMGGTAPGAQGSQVLSAVNLTGAMTAKVAGIADFNQDGHPDVLFQDTKTGAATVYYYTGAEGITPNGTAVLSTGNPWYIAGPH